ncbi:hypothetical protein OAS65_01675 [Methylophilaceae bacterium]|nr:hypothetical protein [Methylophilaceae bacterium]
MLIIPITDGLRIIATEHAWETQEYSKFTSGLERWDFVAHHTTLNNALTYVRERLIKNSNNKRLVNAQVVADNVLMSSLRSQDMFIKELISLYGTEKIHKLNLRDKR